METWALGLLDSALTCNSSQRVCSLLSLQNPFVLLRQMDGRFSVLVMDMDYVPICLVENQ